MSSQAHTALGQFLAETQASAYWFIDPTIDDPTQSIPELAVCPKHPLLLNHPDTRSLAAPYLAICPTGQMADKLHDSCLRLAIAQATQTSPPGEPHAHSVAALLLTDTPLPDLVAGLSSTTTVLDSMGKLRVFRYWDPRIVGCLAHSPTLRPLLPNWLGAVGWIHVDSSGRLQRHELNHQSAIKPDRLSPVNKLSKEQEQDLDLLSRGNQVLMRLRSQGNESDTTVTQHAAIQAIKALEQTPLKYGDDMVTLAVQRIRHACAIETSPKIIALLEQCNSHQLPLSALLSELAAEDWLEIKKTAREFTPT